MNPETLKFLDAMAAKLGTTADYLWAVLIRGNRIEGLILSSLVVIGVAAAYAGYRLIRYSMSEAAGYNDDAYMVWGVITSLIGAPLALGCLYWAVMDICCPEYGALADILSHIGH